MTRAFVLLVVVSAALHAPLGAQDLVLIPGVAAGIAGEGSAVAFGSAGLRLELSSFTRPVSLGYQRLGIGRVCEDSDPPNCDPDTPGGHVFVLEVGHRFGSPASVRRRASLGAGLGLFSNNRETEHNLHFVVNGRLELEVPIGAGHLLIGGIVEGAPDFVLGGVTVGFAIPIVTSRREARGVHLGLRRPGDAPAPEMGRGKR